jgi:metal-responsive CopG/Arc/MetJ family transcriptional regulator
MAVARQISITIPEPLLEEVDRRVGSRGRSQFIAEAVRAYLAGIRRQRMVEGYQARAQENRELLAEFRPARPPAAAEEAEEQ